MPARIKASALYFIFVATTFTATAQTSPKFHVSLEIGDGTRTAYHLGELVPARITLTATDHTKYWVGESCEAYETYPVPVPPHTLAPRARGFGSFCNTHGFGSNEDLIDHPYVTYLLLNRQYQLDTPGTYHLTWTGKPWGTPEITSAPATLILLPPDPAWEAAELARADSLLNTPPPQNQSYPNACNILRFLNTSAAELDMARRFGQSPCGEVFSSALRNAQKPEPVLAVLNHRLQSPDESISPEFLGVLAELSLRQTHPEAYAPVLQTFAEQSHARKLQLQELQRYEVLLAACLPQKSPLPRAESIQSLLSLPTQDYPNPQVLPKPVLTAIQQQMPAVFRSLADPQQNYVLTRLWLDLASPAMEPVLVEVVSNPGSFSAGDTALRRLLQIDPARGREIVLAALRGPDLRFQSVTLESLPDVTLPDLDAALFQNAVTLARDTNRATERSLHLAISLLARYASPAMEQKIQPLFNDSTLRLQCEDRYAILAYLHRVDAPAAEILLPTLKFAPGSGDPTVNNHSACSLEQLAQRYWSPAIEAAMLAQLDAPDARDVSGALRSLQTNGSFYARPAILAAFRRWHDEQQHKTSSSSSALASKLDSQYMGTLLHAQNWLLFADATNAAAQFCLNQECHDEAAHYITDLQNPNPLLITFNAHDNLTPASFGLGNNTIDNLEHLEQKIRQYPNGTALRLDTRQQREQNIQQVASTLGAWALAHDYRFSLYRETY